MQWGHNESCEELYRGFIHLCIKENKTVPLLAWHVLAVIRKEQYCLQSWFASLVKICQEILLTIQCCVTGHTLLPTWRLAVDSHVMLFSLSKITGHAQTHIGNIFSNPLLFYTFCIQWRKKHMPNDVGGREAHWKSLAWVLAWNRWALVKDLDLYEKMVRNCLLHNT